MHPPQSRQRLLHNVRSERSEVNTMSSERLKLLLAELELEVLQEALELYLLARPVPADRRFEYRYRAARSVLENLRQGSREFGTFTMSDYEDVGGREEPSVGDDEGSKGRPVRERLED
jgi:hypothetical protein